jgi:uncharacterized membrane protein YcaP (DUF421 family)
MNIPIVTLRILIGLVLIFGITKVLGKTQISQITPFDFLSSIVIGEIFVHAVFEEKAGIPLLVYPIVLWGALIYIFELMAEKFLPLRSLFEGNPAIIIRNGKIDRNQLKRNKLNLNQLLNLLRQKDVFSISEVKYAILEMNGSLSVLRSSIDDAPTRKDLNLPDVPVYLPVTFISDGKILLDNLRASGFDLPWLYNQLTMQGINDVKKVFYAEWKQDKGLFISLKELIVN